VIWRCGVGANEFLRRHKIERFRFGGGVNCSHEVSLTMLLCFENTIGLDEYGRLRFIECGVFVV